MKVIKMLKNENQAYWCVIRNGKLLLQNGCLPLCSSEQLICSTVTKRIVGYFNTIPVYWLVAETDFDDASFFSLRLLVSGDSALFALAGRAIQLAYMMQSQRFCCHCGHKLQLDANVLAMHCSSCDSIHYSNLMLGFTADYAGGEIKPDYEELTDAIWATAEQLPEVAPVGTIARQLIDTVLELNDQNETY
jgi:NADH pyrophosphatase NudC (nudix superfamily)